MYEKEEGICIIRGMKGRKVEMEEKHEG
jgi:hypothetical protein